MTDIPVSVILPTHNRAALLPRAIRSVLHQTYRDLELIVVDDASTDATPDVIKSFHTDPRVRYIRLERNQRAAAARNVGIKAAKGELIAFQDDDDLWLIEKLSQQVPALLAGGEQVGLNLCGHIRLDSGGPIYVGGDEYFKAIDFANGFRLLALIATPGWLVRRSALDRAGLFDERIKSLDDLELALRLSKVCRFNHINEPLFVQDRVQGDAMFKNHAAFSDDMQIMIDKHSEMWKGNRKTNSRHYFMVGRNEAMYRSAQEGRRWLWKAVRTNPFNLKAWAVLVLAAFGRGSVDSATRSVRRIKDEIKTRLGEH
jgi:glycosyltransferase involved in cell wall biosynthesis